MRGDISGSDALPESRKANDGNIAWQKTGSRAQAYGVACRGIRTIRRKPDCLKPSLQKVQYGACRKDA